ncbi:hypothetical protein [Chengkuizengella marina]|uniref:Uncharacterized protein n=1 Tax=Chengkuizengella marina TaxID=2507566 RepID=A0A6N9Q8T2_9BACL|nr:hypothetical protein [Chengkuizengella marina]NBI31053.1 hypothetical protein [Chengkuizengella marina]
MIIGTLILIAGLIALVLNIIYLLKDELSDEKNGFKVLYLALYIIFFESTFTYFILLIIIVGILKIGGVW